jgi:hypothetical protein
LPQVVTAMQKGNVDGLFRNVLRGGQHGNLWKRSESA